MAEKINIAELDIDIEGILSKQTTLLTQITELKDGQKELRKETENMSNATADQAKEYVQNEAQLKKLNQEYNKNKGILAENTTRVKGLSSALIREVQTVDQARANNKRLLAIRNQVNAKTKEGRQAIDQINEKLDQNNKFIKKNVSTLENQKINIGNYSSALDNAIPGLGRVATGLQSLANRSKFLGKAINSIPILFLISSLLTLATAFASTQSGMDKINRLIAPIKGGLQGIIGVIQDLSVNIISQLSDRWTLFANGVLSNINKIRILWNKLTGDIEEQKALQEYQQTLDGEVLEAQERLNKKSEELSKIWNEAGKRIDKAADDQKRIEELTISIEEKQNESIVAIAKARNELKNFKKDAEDVSKSEQERLIALENAVKQQEFITKKENEINALLVERKELENSLNDTTRDDERELQELIAQRFTAETAGIEQLTTLQNLKNTILRQQAANEIKIVQETLKREEQLRRDALSKIKSLDQEFDQQKALAQNIKFQEDLNRMEEEGASRLSLRLAELKQEEQLAIEAAERNIENETIRQRQIQLIEKEYAGAREQIKAEEEDFKISAAQSTIAQLADVAGKETAVGKAAAVANTTINTYKSATAAYSAMAGIPIVGPALAAAAAGLAIASGLKSVASIVGINTSLPRAEKGLAMPISDKMVMMGGNRHSSGGNEIAINGVPVMEAEKDEILAVMNRNAASLFMDFNNKYQDYAGAPLMFIHPSADGRHQNINILKEGTDNKLLADRLARVERAIVQKKYPGINVSKDGIISIMSDGQSSAIFKDLNYFS